MTHALDPRDDDSPAGRHPPAIALFAAAVIALLAADLAVKSLAFERVADAPVVLDREADGHLAGIDAHEPVVLVPGVLALHLTANQGAVFGLGRGGRWIFVAFSVVAVGVMIASFCRSRRQRRVLHLALAAVVAGALGNLYDRVRFGVVRDMFWLFPGVDLPFGWRWPDGSRGLYPWIFNVADACLVCGLAVIVIWMYRHDRRAGRRTATLDA